MTLCYNQCFELILDGPINLSIVREGGRFKCSADGNPTPTYHWTVVGTNTFREGALFNLDGIYDRESTLQCTATNVLANETKNITLQGWHIIKWLCSFTRLPQ